MLRGQLNSQIKIKRFPKSLTLFGSYSWCPEWR